MMNLYREEILDHARDPRNRGKIPNPTHQSRTPNPLCGDVVDLGIRLEGDPPRVSTVGFEANGCVVAVAAASMLTEAIKEKSVSDLKKINEEQVIGWFGGSLTSSRVECALLPLKALREALKGGEEK